VDRGGDEGESPPGDGGLAISIAKACRARSGKIHGQTRFPSTGRAFAIRQGIGKSDRLRHCPKAAAQVFPVPAPANDGQAIDRIDWN
jgi:hypothetical protein